MFSSVHWQVAAHRLDLEPPTGPYSMMHGSEIKRINTPVSSVACVRFYMLRTVGQLYIFVCPKNVWVSIVSIG